MRKHIVVLAWVKRFPQEWSWKVVVSFVSRKMILLRLNNWRTQTELVSVLDFTLGGWQAVEMRLQQVVVMAQLGCWLLAEPVVSPQGPQGLCLTL